MQNYEFCRARENNAAKIRTPAEVWNSLERLLGRKVDLVEYGDNLNPMFKALVDKKKQLIYG